MVPTAGIVASFITRWKYDLFYDFQSEMSVRYQLSSQNEDSLVCMCVVSRHIPVTTIYRAEAIRSSTIFSEHHVGIRLKKKEENHIYNTFYLFRANSMEIT